MECPHCRKEIIGKPCSACGANVPVESRYCMNCGAYLTEKQRPDMEQEDSVELENRILCPDGNCTGIIIDGKCSECGKPYVESQTEQ